MRVAELSMTFTEELDQTMPFGGSGDEVHMRASVSGSYRLTSSGRLLSARIEKDTTVHMTGSTPALEQHHKQHTSRRMHLVRARDGPTEASLVTPLTREERAIHV